MSAGLYQIRNSQNGHVYYGSTIVLERRWRGHRYMLTRGCHHNIRLQRAWNKYGARVFKFQILCVLESSQLHPTEERLLAKVVGKKWCYNLSKSATNPMIGKVFTEKERQKQSKISKAYWNTCPPEVYRKMVLMWLGRKHTGATKRKMVKAATGRVLNAFIRRKLSIISKQRIRGEKGRFTSQWMTRRLK